MAAKKKSPQSSNAAEKRVMNNKPKSTKPKSGDKPGPWDNIGRGLKTGERFVREVTGVADVERFVTKPSAKTAASLAITAAAYAAGPIAKASQTKKAVQAAQDITRTMEARAAVAAANAAKTDRVVKATKGAGTLTTKSGKKLPVSGMKSFSTAKNPNRAAASTRVQVSKEAKDAYAAAKQASQKKVIIGFGAGGVVGTAKASTTVSVEKNKKKYKK